MRFRLGRVRDATTIAARASPSPSASVSMWPASDSSASDPVDDCDDELDDEERHDDRERRAESSQIARAGTWAPVGVRWAWA